MIELLIVVLIAIAGMCTGRRLLRLAGCAFAYRLEELTFSIAIGFGSLMLVVLALGLSHLLYPPLLWGALIAWAAIGYGEVLPTFSGVTARMRGAVADMRALHLALLGLATLAVGMTLLRALAPPHGATDPLAYQMALPMTFLRNHYLSFEQSVTGALYPTNMGMLYVLALALRDGSLAQVFHWLMGALCMVAIIGFSERYLDRRSGVWGAAIFGFIPVVVVFGPKGYVDVGLCFFQMMAFWALFNRLQTPSRSALLLAAVLTGVSIGVKHQGLATLLVGAILVGAQGLRLHRARGLAPLAAYIAVALLLAAPWYLRSYAAAGNPIWPLANGFFGGLPLEYAPVVLEGGEQGKNAGITSLLPSLDWFRARWTAMSPWTWTFSGNAQYAIGVYFVALLPGLLLFARSRRLYLLILFCLAYYCVLIRVLHMNPRYGLVLFAFLSVLCGYVAERFASNPLRPVRYIFAAGFAATAVLNLAWSYALSEPVWDVAFGRESREHFLSRAEPNFRVFRFVDEKLPPSAVVLLQGIVKGYYCNRQYVWDHPYSGLVNYDDFENPKQMLLRMRELNVSHIARMIRIPNSRLGKYPQYFLHPFHEEFRRKYLKLVYRDESFVLFEIQNHA